MFCRNDNSILTPFRSRCHIELFHATLRFICAHFSVINYVGSSVAVVDVASVIVGTIDITKIVDAVVVVVIVVVVVSDTAELFIEDIVVEHGGRVMRK